MRGNPTEPCCPQIVRTRSDLFAAARVYAVVLAIMFVITALTPKNGGRGNDGLYYASMAADEARDASFIPVAPFCYRVLTPLAVSVLPGPVLWRFRVLNLVVWLGVLIGWHLLARRTGLSQKQSLFGGILLATCAWGPMFSFYTPCYVDPMMYLLIVIGLNLILSGRMGWLAVLLPISMLQREQCAILWVCALVYEHQRQGWSRQLVVRYGLMLLSCVVVWGGLRLAITPIYSTTPAPWTVVFAVVRWLVTDPSYLLKAVLGVLYALGISLVGLAILPKARQYVSQHRWIGYYLVFCLLGLLGGSDKARLAFLAQPALLLVLLHGLSPYLRQRRLRFVAWSLLVLHLFLQYPPSMMVAQGRLEAPLVDAMEHNSHGANYFEDGHWPIPMSTIATHVVFSLVLLGSVFVAMRFDGFDLGKRRNARPRPI